jgi:hypothetical protein
MSIPKPTCPTDCSSNTPEVKFSLCAPETMKGGLSKMYVLSEAFTDITDDAEWATKLPTDTEDQSSSSIKVFYIAGDKPAPEKQIKEIDNGRFITPQKTHTYNIKIYELNDENYEAMRSFECGGNINVVLEDIHGNLYTGVGETETNSGMNVSIDLDHIVPESSDELQTLQGTLKFKSQFHPLRIAKPF